jgi:hypothetical protein
MDEETKNRLRKRFEQMLDSADTRLETLSDLESLALRLREQIAQATLDEAGQELEERQEPADPLDREVQSLEQFSRACAKASAKAPKIICPHCRGNAWSKGERCRNFVTLAGTVRLTRRYFYCRRCDQGFCPLDSRLGLPQEGGFTLRLTQEVACLSACLPFEQAVQTLCRRYRV